MLNNQQPLDVDLKSKPRRYTGVKFFIVTLLIVGAVSVYSGWKAGFGNNIISFDNDSNIWGKVSGIFADEPTPSPSPTPGLLKNDSDYVIPVKEDNRFDILIMGIRGVDSDHADETGPLLTDTIMILSFDRETKKSSLISIPRDFFVKVYNGHEDKINTVYEVGLTGKNPHKFTKETFSKITGIYIDNIAVVDFSAFTKVIDDLGGVDIHLDQPFSEKTQWGYEFTLPAGDNHLDSQNALYYVRSRYSSNDFDRAERQQKVVLAIKDKIKQLNILKDPIVALNIANTIRKNVSTDLDIWDSGTIISLAKDLESADSALKQEVLSTDNFFYQTFTPKGAYILLPKGDNFTELKKFFQDSLK